MTKSSNVDYFILENSFYKIFLLIKIKLNTFQFFLKTKSLRKEKNKILAKKIWEKFFFLLDKKLKIRLDQFFLKFLIFLTNSKQFKNCCN